VNWREHRTLQELQRADRRLAAHGFEDSARLVQRMSPPGTGRQSAISVAFVTSVVIASNSGKVAAIVVAGVWAVGFAAARLIRKPTLPAPVMTLIVGRSARYIDDGIGPVVRLSDDARLEFGSLWYITGFKLTVTDGDQRWVGEADMSRRQRGLLNSVWGQG